MIIFSFIFNQYTFKNFYLKIKFLGDYRIELNTSIGSLSLSDIVIILANEYFKNGISQHYIVKNFLVFSYQFRSLQIFQKSMHI